MVLRAPRDRAPSPPLKKSRLIGSKLTSGALSPAFSWHSLVWRPPDMQPRMANGALQRRQPWSDPYLSCCGRNLSMLCATPASQRSCGFTGSISPRELCLVSCESRYAAALRTYSVTALITTPRLLLLPTPFVSQTRPTLANSRTGTAGGGTTSTCKWHRCGPVGDSNVRRVKSPPTTYH